MSTRFVHWVALLLSLSAPVSAQRVNALFPADGAKDVCPDTPLRLTFDGPPSAGAGKVWIHDAHTAGAALQSIDVMGEPETVAIGGLPNFRRFPVMIVGNQAIIFPRHNTLAYGQTYAVKIDAGAFKGVDAPIRWTFTTKPGPPDKNATKLTVASDGTGDFCTVQGALDFVPRNTAGRTTIFIRKGTYREIVFSSHKVDLTLTGEDRKQTVIEYANNAKFNPANDSHLYHRGVFMADHADGLVISNLTIHNTTPRGGSQAEALILHGDVHSRAVVSGVDLVSFQDTLQINGQAYVENSYIDGDVDFMWGSGPCFFENCHCLGTRSKAYYTQIRNPATNHGYVFHHCTFDGPPDVANMFLSRIDPARFPHSEVVLLDCTLGEAVNPAGWLLNNTQTAPDIHFWEYNSRDPNGKPVDTSKRIPQSKQLRTTEDAKTIEEYSDPEFVLRKGWDPRILGSSRERPPNNAAP